jgi:hypothetical protein
MEPRWVYDHEVVWNQDGSITMGLCELRAHSYERPIISTVTDDTVVVPDG